MISSEDARLVAHIAFAPSGMAGDLETVEAVESQLRQAQADGTLTLPAGYALLPVGSFQNQIEANRRLMVIIPIVILLDLLIIYLNFRNLPLTLIIFSQIPIAVFGGMIGLGIFGIEMNTAIWVGLIALDRHRRRRRRRDRHLHGTTVRPPPDADRPGYSRGHGGSRSPSHSPLLDDGVHDVRRAASRHAGDRPRRRRRAGDGPAGLLRHVRRAGVALRRAGALLRIHGDETESSEWQFRQCNFLGGVPCIATVSCGYCTERKYHDSCGR